MGNNISSTKRVMTDDDRRSSSVHQVVFNDDFLIEILLRLPVISLFLFKSVTKHWLSVITSPAFFNLHLTRFPDIPSPCGFILQKRESQYTRPYETNFVSFNSRFPTGKKKKKSAFTFGCFGSDASNVTVLQSCNGLVLCVIWTYPRDWFYVYNPSINMFKMLPQVDGLELDNHSDHMRLAFDPIKSPHYKVLCARVITRGGVQRRNCIQTWIYSSETGSWKIGDRFSCSLFCWDFDKGVYWNNAIHWSISYIRKVHVMHFNLDVEHQNVTISTEPVGTLDRIGYAELFESRGCLLLACARNHHPNGLKIYEMRRGYSWSVRYTIKYHKGDIDSFFEARNMFLWAFRFKVLFIVVGEREEESFVVLVLYEKVVKYNILSNTLQELCDIELNLANFGTFPFITSFAGV